MTASESAGPEAAVEGPADRPKMRSRVVRVLVYLLISVALGGLGALFWVLIVRLPEYTVEADGRAFTTQEGITGVFGADAWFTGIGIVIGLVVGFLAWRWFRSLGWLAPVLAAVASVVSAVTCWQVGHLLGPGSFDERLAEASPGDIVQIPLDVHAPIVVALWVMTAELPVLIAASLLHDPEDPPPEATQTDLPEVSASPEGPPSPGGITETVEPATSPQRKEE